MIGSPEIKAFQSKNVLYSRHLRLYKQYVEKLLRLYERHYPGCCALLALVSMDQDYHCLLKSSIGFGYHRELRYLALSPIVHPQRWDPDGPALTEIVIPFGVLESGVYPLLASILSPRVPQICLETATFCLRYLQSGCHSGKTRKSLKPLLKPSYFMRLKMRPFLSRFRKRRHLRSDRHCFLGEERLCSVWWGNHQLRPNNSYTVNRGRKDGMRVSLWFFSYRFEYACNYDLWYTYRHAVRLLPFFLSNATPNSRLASIASNCIFNSFCTAYPQDTRKAKKSIKRYLSRCRSIIRDKECHA